MLKESKKFELTDVPVIDLQNDHCGNISRNTVDRMGAACEGPGFFYISNHGVAGPVINNLVEAAREFFAQDASIKKRWILDSRMRGYLPLYYKSYSGEKNAGTSHQEGFWIGDDRPLDINRPLDGPNQWPDSPSNLQPSMEQYQQQLQPLVELLLQCFALSLGLEADAFDRLFARPTSRLKLNHYPPQLNPQDENNIGVIPHTDSGGFTILWQDENSGLEIKAKSGEWLAVPPIANTFVVNLGNMMPIWSNQRFGSTPHRVINRNNVDRYSIPLFVNPDQDVEIAPLIGDSVNAVEPFHYGDYQRDFWRRAFPVARIP